MQNDSINQGRHIQKGPKYQYFEGTYTLLDKISELKAQISYLTITTPNVNRHDKIKMVGIVVTKRSGRDVFAQNIKIVKKRIGEASGNHVAEAVALL